MQAGTLLLIIAEVIQLLQAQGFIATDGTFDDQKFNDVASDLALVGGVEAILKKHGVAVPGKVDEILQLLPLIARLFVK